MQLIEVSDLAVRSAEVWLRQRNTPMRFGLFPMLHVGAPSFYEEVTRRLRVCDLVVAKRICGRSLTSSALTLKYWLFGNTNRDGPVVQHIDYSSLGVPVVGTLRSSMAPDTCQRSCATWGTGSAIGHPTPSG